MPHSLAAWRLLKKSHSVDSLTRRASARFDAERAASARQLHLWQAAFDGSAEGGHGRMSGGGVIYAPDGRVIELRPTWPGHGCNNEAEYRALIAVLEALAAHGARRVHVWGDSDLVIRQLRGEQPAKAARLAPWQQRMRELCTAFESLDATWIPRHRNARADALAQRTEPALGEAPSASAGEAICATNAAMSASPASPVAASPATTPA